MFDYFTFGGAVSKKDNTVKHHESAYEPLSPDDISPSAKQISTPQIHPSGNRQRDSGFNDSQTIRWCLPSPPVSEDLDFADQLDRCLNVTELRQSSTPGTSDCRRLRRQRNLRLMCTTTHTKRMEAMLGDMVLTKSQCNVVPGKTSPAVDRVSAAQNSANDEACSDRYSILPDDATDEGYHGCEEDIRKRSIHRMMYSLSHNQSPTSVRSPEGSYVLKRAGDSNRSGTSSGQPRVLKQIRQRKSRGRGTAD